MDWGSIELFPLVLFGVSSRLKYSNAPAILLLLGKLDVLCYVQSENAKSLIIDMKFTRGKKERGKTEWIMKSARDRWYPPPRDHFAAHYTGNQRLKSGQK